MAQTQHIEALQKSLEAGNVTAAELNTFRERISKEMVHLHNASPDTQNFRKSLSALRQSMNTPEVQRKIEEQEKIQKGISESLMKLSNELDRNFAGAYHPETGALEAGGALQAGLNRYTLFERENINPNAVLPLRIGLIAAAGAATLYAIKSIWHTLEAVGGKLLAVGTSVGGAIAAFSWMPQSWRDGIGNFFGGLRSFIPESWRPYLPDFLTPEPEAKKKAADDAAKKKAAEDKTKGMTEEEKKAAEQKKLEADKQDAAKKKEAEEKKKEEEVQQKELNAFLERAQALERGASVLSRLAGRYRFGSLNVEVDAANIRINGRRLLVDVGLIGNDRLNLSTATRCLVPAVPLLSSAGEGIEVRDTATPPQMHRAKLETIRSTLQAALAAFAQGGSDYSALGVRMRLE